MRTRLSPARPAIRKKRATLRAKARRVRALSRGPKLARAIAASRRFA